MTNEQRARIEKIRRDAKLPEPRLRTLPDGTMRLCIPVSVDLTVKSLALSEMRQGRNN